MPYAIVLKCTDETVTPVLDLWREASRFETAPSMQALNYPPHLTFAVYQDIALPSLFTAAQKAFAGVPPISVEFSGIGHFSNEMLVLWARPTDDRVLRRIQRVIHDEIDPALCHEHSRPDCWQPHCTVAMKIPTSAREEALAWAKATPAKFTLIFDAVDCVSFPPVEILQEVKLPS